MSPLQAHNLEIGADFERCSAGLYVPAGIAEEFRALVDESAPVDGPRPVGVDLFAGAGGFSCGFKMAGWHVAAAAEWDIPASMTYLRNLGGSDTRIVFLDDEAGNLERKWEKANQRQAKRSTGLHPPGSGWIATQPDVQPCEVFYLGDVRSLTGKRILADLGRDVDCVFGGPPCQGYSTSGKRQVMDPRNSLVFEFMRLVVDIRPKSFVMENVPDIVSMVTPEGLPVIDALARIAEDGSFGTVEAIKRALLASSGAGAAMRTTKVRREGDRGVRGMALDRRDRLGESDDAEQMAMEFA